MPTEMQLQSEWLALTETLGVSRSVSLTTYTDLCRRYSDPSRSYHTLTHVTQMLQTLDDWRQAGEIQDWAAVRLAVWFHDAVYDSRAADNEEQSAALAVGVLAAWAVADETQATVERLILATKTHTPTGDDPDGALLLDADLAILGSAPSEYEAYGRAIRAEYAWVADDAYRAGRGRVLQGFLDRPRIYRTPMAYDAWETQARYNIGAEIGRLQR